MVYLSTSSVLDVTSSSEEESEEIALMTSCAEKQLADPIPIPGPSSNRGNTRVVTTRPALPLHPTFNQGHFNLGRGNGAVPRDNRTKNNQSIILRRNLVLLCPHRPKIPYQNMYVIWQRLRQKRSPAILTKCL